jgi:hypothetical protein
VSNLVPRRYRGVSVTDVEFPLEPEALRSHFLGREAYRRTAFVVARSGPEAAVLAVRKASDEPLFSPIVEVEVLAGPEETAFVHAPDVDTGVPTQLARAAARLAPGARCVVVHGRYEHVNLVLDPSPGRIRVIEVAPPDPPKLLDQVARVLELAEDLPPVQIEDERIDLLDLARSRPAERYLFPCRGSGVAPAGAEVAYLDERPARRDWTLVGCARSREIHRAFYGDEPPSVEMCPRELARERGVVGPTLTKCCLLEEELEREGDTVVVPWGASLAQVREGLAIACRISEPTWAPA